MAKCWRQNRPVLIGTTNVKESEMLRSVLQKFGEDTCPEKLERLQLLNARPEAVRQEAQVRVEMGMDVAPG